jgi:hypothetical protein
VRFRLGETVAQGRGQWAKVRPGGHMLRDEALALRRARSPPAGAGEERDGGKDEKEAGAGHGIGPLAGMGAIGRGRRGATCPRPAKTGTRSAPTRNARVRGVQGTAQGFAGRQRVMRSMRSKGG